MFLHTVEAGKVVAFLAALSPRGESLARIPGFGVSAECLEAVRRELPRRAGMIEMALPTSYPAQAQRLADVGVRLAENKSAQHLPRRPRAGEPPRHVGSPAPARRGDLPGAPPFPKVTLTRTPARVRDAAGLPRLRVRWW